MPRDGLDGPPEHLNRAMNEPMHPGGPHHRRLVRVGPDHPDHPGHKDDEDPMPPVVQTPAVGNPSPFGSKTPDPIRKRLPKTTSKPVGIGLLKPTKGKGSSDDDKSINDKAFELQEKARHAIDDYTRYLKKHRTLEATEGALSLFKIFKTQLLVALDKYTPSNVLMAGSKPAPSMQ